MEIKELLNHLNSISEITNEQWLDNLNDRKLKELQFHNSDRDKTRIEKLDGDTYEKFYGNKRFYKTVNQSKTFVNNWLRDNVKDKVFLDYACGNGEYALYAAKCGAKLSIGLDISDISIINAREEASKLGLENTFFFQADAENTKLQDSCIDVIICSGMLHHLDLSYAFPELRRILAKNGKILAIEALDYNPFIKFYRYLTPAMRTEWEKRHILSLKDIRFAKHFFTIGKVKYWHITSYLGAYAPYLQPVLNFIDKILVKIPIIRLLSWMFTFELLSNKSDNKG